MKQSESLTTIEVRPTMMTIVLSSSTAPINDWLDKQAIQAIVIVMVRSHLRSLQFGVQQWFKILSLDHHHGDQTV
jgi:hypothetical protein